MTVSDVTNNTHTFDIIYKKILILHNMCQRSHRCAYTQQRNPPIVHNAKSVNLSINRMKKKMCSWDRSINPFFQINVRHLLEKKKVAINTKRILLKYYLCWRVLLSLLLLVLIKLPDIFNTFRRCDDSTMITDL